MVLYKEVHVFSNIKIPQTRISYRHIFNELKGTENAMRAKNSFYSIMFNI